MSSKRMRPVRYLPGYLLCAVLVFGSVLSTPATAAPKVVVISLDGATPGNVERFLNDGTLSKKRGLGLLIKHGVMAERNITVTPSLTAPGHIAIATGSTAGISGRRSPFKGRLDSLFVYRVTTQPGCC